MPLSFLENSRYKVTIPLALVGGVIFATADVADTAWNIGLDNPSGAAGLV